MAQTQRDPVCNMELGEENAAGQSQHQGQTYYFCSEECKEKFDQNPQQYVKGRGQGAGGSV